MIGRIFRQLSTIASLLLLVAVPTQASPIKFADVVNVMGDLHRGHQNEQLRLRVTQDPAAPLNVRSNIATSNSTGVSPATDENVVTASNELAATENSSTSASLVAGTDIARNSARDVQVFDHDQSVVRCDCGESPAVEAAFKVAIPSGIPVCLTVSASTRRRRFRRARRRTPPILSRLRCCCWGPESRAELWCSRRYAKMRRKTQHLGSCNEIKKLHGHSEFKFAINAMSALASPVLHLVNAMRKLVKYGTLDSRRRPPMPSGWTATEGTTTMRPRFQLSRPSHCEFISEWRTLGAEFEVTARDVFAQPDFIQRNNVTTLHAPIRYRFAANDR